MPRILLCAAAALVLAACSTQRPRARNVEADLLASGFETVVPNTPQKREVMRRLPARRLTERARAGKPYYWYADPDGCGCVYVGGEDAYRRYDRLAQARDDAASDRADARMLRDVRAEEHTPPDAWFWQDMLPEYFPE